MLDYSIKAFSDLVYDKLKDLKYKQVLKFSEKPLTPHVMPQSGITCGGGLP